MIAGYLFATEYEYLKEQLPEARFVNALDLMDEVTFVKEPGEIKLMRQAAAIADTALVINVPDVGGMRLECPVRVTASGGEMLTTTPLELTVLDG